MTAQDPNVMIARVFNYLPLTGLLNLPLIFALNIIIYISQNISLEDKG
jgi:hypothetical protein